MDIKSLMIVFLLTVCNASFCQIKDFPFSRIDIRDGLSDNQIVSIFKDHQGYVWFGTTSGLNRYDGYTIKVFRHDVADSNSISDNYVEHIFEGPENCLYIASPPGGINIYNPLTQQFKPQTPAWLQKQGIPLYGLIKMFNTNNNFYFVYRDSGVYKYQPGKMALRIWPGTGRNGMIVDAATDASGNLWLSYQNRLLQKIDLAGKKNATNNILQRQISGGSFGYKLFIDSEEKAWLFAPGHTDGLFELDLHTGTLLHFSRDSGQTRLNSNIVSDVAEDDKGLIWIAADQGGVVLLDKKQMKTQYLVNSDEERSLSQNTITTLYRDNTGTVWAGTFKKGVCYYQQNAFRFPLYRRQPGLPGSLPFNDVNCFAEDKNGNIWIGTNGGGLIYFNRFANTFTRYLHSAGNGNSISSDVVITLTLDHAGKLWIGTYQGGLDCFDGHSFTHYRHKDADPGSLSDDNVYAVKEDSNNDLWIGTLMNGLDRLDRQQNKFYHNNALQPYSVHSNYISSLAYDKEANLWIGTAYGIDVLRKNTGKYEYYTKENSKLGDNNVNTVLCDSRGNMWVATRNGLSVLQPGKDSFQVFRMKEGLPSNAVLNMLEDSSHVLWVSTLGGLTKIAVFTDNGRISIKCVNYDEYDGLQGREFNTNAALRTSKGELIFGGANGFNLFSPSAIGTDKHIPPVVLTGLQLFNKEAPLPASIASDGRLVLQYGENNFSLEFAALSFINAKKNRYAYQLAGVDKGWVLTDGRNRLATYTNIDPGEYVFKVRASNSDGVWNDEGVTINIIIKPPFWKTPLAYTFYVLCILAALYAARLNIIRKARAKFALAEERREALRMRELDRMKIKFITNLSHEFRTPLSLILSPAEKLAKTSANQGQKQLAKIIEKNARRLLYLVNQLLDIRKMEVNELKLNVQQYDIAVFIRDTTSSFADLAEEKGIDLTYHSDLQHFAALFDKDKVERIIFNLLSNALKFTTAGGSIDVKLGIAEEEEGSALLQLTVTDTGIGIAPEMQEKIFDSFFQGELPGHILNQGSGIGLAITKEFVEMHGGTIKVESTPGKGSCFTVLLPLEVPADIEQEAAGWRKDEVEQETLLEEEDFADDNEEILSDTNTNQKDIKILLVEDDSDFRFYLKDNLAPIFTILEASNGQEGWKKTLAAQPHLVVSDVNMPLMDGLELCKKIKGDVRVRHIPVLLLTALSGEEDQLRALGTGANDFISKPFNVEILLSRIRNILDYKGSMEQVFKRRVDINPGQVEVEAAETKDDFINKAVSVLEKNVDNADFSVTDWCKALHMSRTRLYNEILVCTGKTPISFIRSFRLQRAAQLLEKSRYNVTEVAYMVGFNNPKYFTRYFKEQFGMLPSVYQAQKRKRD
jgi:signal transduction histidine kinase/ligand-binding sensor domain-containing protein/DNA-binding response OmpR family regulator